MSASILLLFLAGTAGADAGGDLRPLMLAVLSAPEDPAPRERLRRAAALLAERSREEAHRKRVRLMNGNDEALTYLRVQAEQWDTLVAASRQAAAGGRWALALDRAGAVLDENPRHGAAREAAAAALRGMARAIDDGPPASDRTALLYKGLLAFTADESPRARRLLRAALGRPEPQEELDDARIGDYLAELEKAKGETRIPTENGAGSPSPAAAPATPVPGVELAAERAAAARRVSEAEAAALYDRGIAAYALDRLEEARALWRAALEADPDHQMARKALRHVESLPPEARR